MNRWQGLVLGTSPPGFRTGPAFAKGGADFYGWDPTLPARFDRYLVQAQGKGPLVIRAARLYLDVLFVHPFPDGNGRAARLALDHLLTREGKGLYIAGPAFQLWRSASLPSVNRHRSLMGTSESG